MAYLVSGQDLVPQSSRERRNGRHTNILRQLKAWTGSAGEWVQAILSVPGSQLLDEPGQRLTHRFERVGIVGVGRQSFPLEVRPLALHPSPFDISFANKFLQEVVRVENLPAEGGQH